MPQPCARVYRAGVRLRCAPFAAPAGRRRAADAYRPGVAASASLISCASASAGHLGRLGHDPVRGLDVRSDLIGHVIA
jgi:hypothetical protein